jgi:Ser/Thr protein kinase RdoA (MazF antagonist)
VAHQAGLPVPAPGDMVEVDGRVGIELERVDGPSMQEWMTSRPWRMFRAAATLAELHARTHSVEVTGLTPMREVVEGRVSRAERWPAALKEATLEAVRRLPVGNGICHWDFHTANIVMTGHGPIIIDWSEAVRGNPLADVAMTWLLASVTALPPWMKMKRLVRQGRRRFCAAYLKDYRRLRPFRDEDLTAWKIPAVAADAARGIPEDHERMLTILEELLRQNGYLATG